MKKITFSLSFLFIAVLLLAPLTAPSAQAQEEVTEPSLLEQIKESGKQSRCAELTDPTELGSCNKYFAIVEGKPELCQWVSDPTTKESCEVHARRECEKLSGNNADLCNLRKAEDTKDVETCRQIGTAYTQDHCYARLASILGNSSICERITGQTGEVYDFCLRDSAGGGGVGLLLLILLIPAIGFGVWKFSRA
jgi:hypothetical protein